MPDTHPFDRANNQPPRDVIEDAVRQVLGSMTGDLTSTETLLLGELDALAQEIARAKREMAALQVQDINDQHIPVATDELDAVLDHTAEATNEILDCCEALEKLATTLPVEPAATVNSAVTRIYEACSFQDITGQRIAKVVTALKSIENRLLRISERFGGHGAPVREEIAPVTAQTEGRALANGPQMPGAGTSQADIDSLLASFD
jgi:chemotaxis protein CheZ